MEMGRNFRAPKHADVDQWKKVRILYEGGVRFWGTQSPGLGDFPETCKEASEFVERNRPVLDRQEAAYRRYLNAKKDRDQKKRGKQRALKAKRKAELGGKGSSAALRSSP